MNFLFIVMRPQFINMDISLIYLADALGCKVSRKTVLPEQMLPFYFAFRLGSGCILKTDPEPF